MKRTESFLAIIGVVLLAVGARQIRTARGPSRDIVLAEGCRSPLRVLEPRAQPPFGSAVVFHGIAANRRLMQTFGQSLAGAGLRVYLVDSPGHGDSLEPFSFARAEQCAAAVLEALARRGEILRDRTVLVGHSLGAATAVRLADRFPTSATIALSPAPMNLPRRMPANLLIVYAQLDPRPVKDTAQKLLRAAGGERLTASDFAERRAVRLDFMAWASHVSVLYDPRVERAAGDWARSALSEKAVPPARGSPFMGGVLGVAGLLLLFPFVATGFTALCRASSAEPNPAGLSIGRLLALWAVASLFSVGVLNFWVPLRALRMWNGDYLVSFHLLAGTILLLLLWREGRAPLDFSPRATIAACLFGLASILAIGGWLNWQLTDGWMNLARWERFVPIVVMCLPYFLAEELALGPPAAEGRFIRFAVFLAMRVLLWLALVFALFAFDSQQILVLLLAVFLLAIALVQRWGADAIRRRTGSVAAAALASAIFAAWLVAAVFPLT